MEALEIAERIADLRTKRDRLSKTQEMAWGLVSRNAVDVADHRAKANLYGAMIKLVFAEIRRLEGLFETAIQQREL